MKMDVPIQTDAAMLHFIMWFVIGTVVLLLARGIFKFRYRTLVRMGVIIMIMMFINSSGPDEASVTTLLKVVLTLYVIYAVIAGIVGFIYRTLTGGEHITPFHMIMGVLGVLGFGKVSKMEKRSKEEHEEKMKQTKRNEEPN